jgi:coenzyme PQQ synthesis protein D (PqqD)
MHISVSPDALFQELDGETVLLNLHDESYYGLDDVGTRVWQLLSEHGNMDQVIAAMLNEYEVDEAILRRDIERLIAELAQCGLVTIELGERA